MSRSLFKKTVHVLCAAGLAAAVLLALGAMPFGDMLVTGKVGINKTATVALDVSGAAAVTGDLTVDSPTFRVDTTHNRVSIGIAYDPISPLFVGGGDIIADYSTGGALGGGATRIASNANAVYYGTNAFYNGASTVRARAGGASQLTFDITNGATAGDIVFQTAGSGDANAAVSYADVMTIKAGGNVGIGVSPSASAKLHVYTAGASEVRAQSSASPFTTKFNMYHGDTSGMSVMYDPTVAKGYIDSYYHPTASGQAYGNLYFRSNKGGTNTLVENMVIEGYTGNVGIGSTDAPAPLTVVGAKGTNTSQIQVYDSASVASSVGGKISFFGKAGTARTYDIFGSISGIKENATSSNYSGALAFNTITDGGNESEKMRITSGGNVGIGNASPSHLLVSGNGTTSSCNSTFKIIATDSSAATIGAVVNNKAIYLYNDGNTTFKLDAYNYATSSALNFSLATNGGNVGIGCTPGYQLELSTNSAAKPTSDHWTISSDARLKQDIADIVDPLSKLLSLKGRTFKWIPSERAVQGANTQMGFIAQEVETVFPEWVGTNNKGTKNLTTVGMDALVVESIRALNAKIEALEARIKTLEAK